MLIEKCLMSKISVACWINNVVVKFDGDLFCLVHFSVSFLYFHFENSEWVRNRLKWVNSTEWMLKFRFEYNEWFGCVVPRALKCSEIVRWRDTTFAILLHNYWGIVASVVTYVLNAYALWFWYCHITHSACSIFSLRIRKKNHGAICFLHIILLSIYVYLVRLGVALFKYGLWIGAGEYACFASRCLYVDFILVNANGNLCVFRMHKLLWFFDFVSFRSTVWGWFLHFVEH